VDSFQKIERLLECGVDKVVIGTACYTDPDFVKACVAKLGAQFVIASVDYKNIDGKDICFSRNGTINEQITVADHSRALSNIGVGEILLTSIDKEGHMNGYDLNALQEIRTLVDIPIIVNGGAGDRISDFYQPFDKGADAVAASSTFLFTEITPKKVSVELKKLGINTRVA
jgi:cyclase